MVEDPNGQVYLPAIQEILSYEDLGDYQSTFSLLEGALQHFSKDKAKEVKYTMLGK